MRHDEALEALEEGPALPLRDIHDDLTGKYQPGLYTLWLDGEFLYAGMSYRASDPTPDEDGKHGVWGRLGTHYRGRSRLLSRELMARFVIPDLTTDEIKSLRTHGYEMLKPKLRGLLDQIKYRVWITPTGEDARALEARVRRDGLPRAGQPLLNPK